MNALYKACFCTALAAAALPVFAQDTTPIPEAELHPLHQMISLVPNLPVDDLGIIGYTDYRALQSAREGVPTYATWMEMAMEPDPAARMLWTVNNTRLVDVSGRPFGRYFRMDTPALVGFDQFDVNQSLSFGIPGEVGFVYKGNFDQARITEAFLARDYEVIDKDGLPLLQRADGVDPSTVDLMNRSDSDPFGGEVGRKETIALLPGMLLNSASNERLESMIDASTTPTTNIISAQPRYAAAANAVLVGDGSLVQALFVDGLTLMSISGGDPSVVMTATPQPGTPAYMQDYGPLPMFSLLVMADRQEGTDQVIRFALVYGDEASATTAAAELTKRLAAFTNAQLDSESTTTMLDEVAGHMAEPQVYHDTATDLYVALVDAHHPMPANTGEPPAPLPSGLLFRTWFTMLFYLRSFYPLTVQ